MSAFGTKQTSNRRLPMTAFGGKADVGWRRFNVRLRPKADIERFGIAAVQTDP